MQLLTPKDRRHLGLLVAFRTSVGFLDLLMAAAFYLLFLLLQGHPLPAAAHLLSGYSFVKLAAITIAITLLRALAEIFSATALARNTSRLHLDLLGRLLQGYRMLRWESFVARNQSELASIAINTSREAAEYYHRLIELIAASITTLAMTSALFYSSPKAAVLLLLMAAGFYALHRWGLRARLRRAADAKEGALKAANRAVYELLRCAREIRVYGNSKFFEDKTQQEVLRFSRANLRVGLLPLISRTVTDQGIMIVFLIVLIAAFLAGADTGPLVSMLVFFFIITRRMLPLLGQISFIAGQMEDSYANVLVVAHELKECKADKIQGQAPVPSGDEAPIQCADLSFGYSESNDLLRAIDLKIGAGEIVAIRGASGSGKSTLLCLLAGLIEARNGEVKPGTQAIAYVPQEIALLDASVYENVVFGDNSISLERIYRSLSIAGLFDFIATLPEGIETRVGDNGTLLSGGQRQRLGLARAIYRQPELLLLDEATSALDPATESQVLENIRSLGCAVVLATHRTLDPSLVIRTATLQDSQLLEHTHAHQ